MSISSAHRQRFSDPIPEGLGSPCWVQTSTHDPNTMNTTASSSKDQIITAAVELADCQAHQIGQLKERQLVLWALVGVLSVLLMLGA
jgi:hypothetical protein